MRKVVYLMEQYLDLKLLLHIERASYQTAKNIMQSILNFYSLHMFGM